MSSEHFTLTISQSTTDSGDFAIHMKEDGKAEQLLVHLRFANLPMLNEPYLDEIAGLVARKLAKRIIEWRVVPDTTALLPNNTDQKKAMSIVQGIIKNMKKA